MTCDVIRNRLLALPDLRRVPDELRNHLDECPACRAYLAWAARIDKLVAAIPVPAPSAEVKAAFLDRVTEAGPVIKRVPVVRRDSAFNLPAFLAENGRWRYAAGLAAAVLIAVGLLSLRDEPQLRAEPQTVAGHELLRKTIGNVVTDKEALAKVNTPEQRMKVWADVTADLRDEIKRVYLHAPEADLTALAGLFEKATERGLLPQADAVRDNQQLPADQQQALLRDAILRMTEVEADLTAFAQNAPVKNKPPLRLARDTARKVREGLADRLARHVGSVPAKGV